MILRFEEDFPGAKIFKLEENYRSTQAILAAANELVANNQSRSAKKLFTKRAEGEPITAYPAETERDRSALRRREDQRTRPRRRGLPRLPDALPHQRTVARLRRGAAEPKASRTGSSAASGSTRAPKIKDMIAYLRYIVNPSDAVAFRRIVNVPRRSIGQQTLASLVDAANSAGRLRRAGDLRQGDCCAVRSRRSRRSSSVSPS